MSLDRSQNAPIPCRYTADDGITKAHANRHFPVQLVAEVNGRDQFERVAIQSSADEDLKVFGELLDVFPESMTCTVQYCGLLYLRSKEAITPATVDLPVSMSDTVNAIKAVEIGDTSSDVSDSLNGIVNAPITLGGFTIDESGTTVNIAKCRR